MSTIFILYNLNKQIIKITVTMKYIIIISLILLYSCGRTGDLVFKKNTETNQQNTKKQLK